MWLIIAFASLLAYTTADIFAKKNVDASNENAPYEMLICVQVLAFVISMGLYIFGLGESGLAPWEILIKNPLIIANFLCHILYWFTFMISMRFIGLSVESGVSGATGILYFLGLLLINLFTSKLVAVRDMLHPARFIPIIVFILFTFLLPNTELISAKRKGESVSEAKTQKRRTVIGLAITVLSMIIDTADSLITTVIFDSGNVGTVDYITSSYFSSIIVFIILSVILRRKTGRFYIPFSKGTKGAGLYAVASISSTALYLFASAFDAVRTGILFIIYPALPIIGARIFLKEKYNWRQNVCIWIITLSAIAFCIADGLL